MIKAFSSPVIKFIFSCFGQYYHLWHLSQPLALVVDARTREVSFPWRKIIDMDWNCWITRLAVSPIGEVEWGVV